MTVWTLPREAVEYVGPITATDNGTPVAVFQVALVARGTRPAEADWTDPTDVAGEKYLLVGAAPLDLAAGSYVLWVRWTAAPETPVVDNAGVVLIT